MFIIGQDLGQAQDYTATIIVEKSETETTPKYQIRRIERTRGTPYPQIIARTVEIVDKIPGSALVVDQTGVGAPVVDSFRQAGLKPIGVSIHGGDKVSNDRQSYRVPKRDLVAVVQVLLQNDELKAAPIPMAPVLQEELRNFKIKIDPQTAHDSYSAWRERDHDDLVLATALACWWGENMPTPISWTTGKAARSGPPVPSGWFL